MPEKVTLEYIGFHGTDAANEQSILKNSFKKSDDSKDWYGTGAYFFIDGISDRSAVECAVQWSKDWSWDKRDKKYRYVDYIVLQAKIKILDTEILDLTDFKGLHLFNRFREGTRQKILDGGKKVKDKDISDSHIFEIMKQKLNIKVIIGNVFIKFADIRKMTYYRSNVPNVTIMCVDNTKTDYIDVCDLQVKMKGAITI